MRNEPIKRTPVYAALQKQGMDFVTVAGWQVVAGFGGVDEEVAAAETAVALAEQSARGKVMVQGVEADVVVAGGVWGAWVGDWWGNGR